MNSNLSGLGKMVRIISWLLAISFVVTLPPAVMLRATSATVFSPEILASSIQQALLENGSLRQAVVQSLLDSQADTEDETLAQLTADLSSEEWQRISEIAVPDEWLAGQIGQLTSSLISWLDEDELLPNLRVNVEPVKRRLVGQDSQEIVEIVVASWPACSLQEALAFEDAFRQGAQLPFSACSLPDPYRNIVVARITEELQSQVRSMPSSLDLMESPSQAEIAQMLPVKSRIRQIRLLTRWSLLVPISLLGFLMALSIRSLWQLTRWWGLSLFLGGALTLALTLITADALVRWLTLLSQSIELPAASAFSIQTLIGELADRVIRRSAIGGAVLGGIGALLSFASLILPQPKARSIPLSRRPGTG